MNETGFTGFNPEEFKNNLENFMWSCCSAIGSTALDYMNCFDRLSEVWASPRAVEFYKKTYEEGQEMIKEICDEACKNVRAVCRAYVSHAISNGYDVSIDPEFYCNNIQVSSNQWVESEVLPEKNGIVGMNISYVKDVLIPDFEKILCSDERLFEEIPNIIALYDESNSQSDQYIKNISDFIQRVNSFLWSFLRGIKYAMTLEADTIELAAAQATEALEESSVE